MLSYKMDFSSCAIMPGFGKSSHISSINKRNNKLKSPKTEPWGTSERTQSVMWDLVKCFGKVKSGVHWCECVPQN